jgi:polyhydroxyalkanoate synthase
MSKPAEASAVLTQAGAMLLQNFLKLFPRGSEQGDAWKSLIASYRADPSALSAIQARYLQEQLSLWNSTLAGSSSTPSAGQQSTSAPEAADKRFAGREWRENPHFAYASRSYLLSARFFDELVEAAKLDEPAKDKLRFF